MSLEQWAKNGWLRSHKPSAREISDLLEIVDRDPKDAQGNISADWKFGIAYNAALKLCTILLHASGYRPEQKLGHYRTLMALPLILGESRKDDSEYLDACRAKRNTVEYDTAGAATEDNAAELIDFVTDLRQDVLAWLRKNHPELLALDSNLPLDLAADLDAAHTFREVFLERGYRLFVPLTVVTELTLLEEDESDAKKAALALRALQSLRGWDIEPYGLKSVEHGIAGEFARRLITQGLLPDDEFNDGVILAESSLAKIPVPVTSDHHLLDISPGDLQPEFIAADLAPVTIAHPKSLLRALR